MLNLIYFGLAFILGAVSVMLLRAWKQTDKELGELLTMFPLWIIGLNPASKYADLFQKTYWWASVALVLLGVYYLLGPNGWAYNDFMHYAKGVFCFPRNWTASLTNEAGDVYRYENGTARMITNPNISFTIKNFTLPPANPADDVFYKGG